MSDYKSDKFNAAMQKHIFESEQQVSRNNFYMVFQGVVIAGYFQFLGSSVFSSTSSSNVLSIVYLSLICLMIFISVFQFETACGSAGLIMKSSHNLIEAEKSIDKNELSEKISVFYPTEGDKSAEWFSVAKESMVNENNGCFSNLINSCLIIKIKKAHRVSVSAIYVSVFFYLFWLSNLFIVVYFRFFGK